MPYPSPICSFLYQYGLVLYTYLYLTIYFFTSFFNLLFHYFLMLFDTTTWLLNIFNLKKPISFDYFKRHGSIPTLPPYVHKRLTYPYLFKSPYFSTSFARKLCISSNAIPVFAAIVSSSSISSSALATSLTYPYLFKSPYFSTSFARKLCISSNAIPVFAAIVSSSSISSSALATSNLPFFIPCSIPSSLHPSIFCFFFQFLYCPCNICNHMFYLLLIRIQNFYCLLCNAFLYCISYPVFKF